MIWWHCMGKRRIRGFDWLKVKGVISWYAQIWEAWLHKRRGYIHCKDNLESYTMQVAMMGIVRWPLCLHCSKGRQLWWTLHIWQMKMVVGNLRLGIKAPSIRKHRWSMKLDRLENHLSRVGRYGKFKGCPPESWVLSSHVMVWKRYHVLPCDPYALGLTSRNVCALHDYK